jgi:type IV pilus assembly protein PilW
MNPLTSFHRQQGLSLVELMVALVISVFLLGGVVQVYTANKSTYRFSEAMSRIQENARYALDTMARDLRMAGFWGCATFDPDDPSNIQNNLDPAGAGYDSEIHDFIGQPPVEGTENDGLNGSDSIRVRGSQPGQANVVAPYNSPTSAQIFINQADFVAPGDIVMLTNCKGADIFQVTNVTNGGGTAQQSVVHNSGAGSPGNSSGGGGCPGVNPNCLSQTYGGDSSLLKLQSARYYIAPGASGEPALWRNLNGTDQELIDGVEQLQILYGIDTDDNKTPNQYVTSDNVGDWNQVVAVRLMLLLRSPENVSLDAPQTYRFNNVNTVAADNRLRQAISTTIALRNRIP